MDERPLVPRQLVGGGRSREGDREVRREVGGRLRRLVRCTDGGDAAEGRCRAAQLCSRQRRKRTGGQRSRRLRRRPPVRSPGSRRSFRSRFVRGPIPIAPSASTPKAITKKMDDTRNRDAREDDVMGGVRARSMCTTARGSPRKSAETHHRSISRLTHRVSPSFRRVRRRRCLPGQLIGAGADPRDGPRRRGVARAGCLQWPSA